MSKRSHSAEDAPRKQLRPEDEDESGDLPPAEDEEVEDAVAGPSQRQSEDEEVEDAVAGPSQRQSEDEEVEDAVAGPSQRQSCLPSKPLTPAGSSQEGAGGQVGIVESITLRNFMCHALLGPFTFSSNVNFVVGNNGSGKSAILTALIVALGGNAQATNRGSSLKGFVKEGESSADVSVTLRNIGKDAYRPEVYGSSITVDVKITREGARSFKLKNKSGHIISSKKEELQAVLDNLNIQVDNPISILTQEMSKHFLHSKGEGDKYRFFMKATQLDRVKGDLMYVKQSMEVTKSKMEQHSECLVDLRRKYREKEEQYKSLASLDEMNNKLNELAKKMAWAVVSDLEQELQPLQDQLLSDQSCTVKYNEKVQEWKNKVSEAEQMFSQIQDQVESITQRHKDLQPQCAELKTKAQQKNNLLKSGEVSVHRYKATLNALEKDKAQLSQKIEELNLSISNGSEAESQARAALIEKHENKMESLRHQDSTLGVQMDQYQQAITLTKEELCKIRREKDTLERSMDAIARNLQTMEGSRSNRLRRFGEHMPGFLSAIEEAYNRRQFKEKPRGPLGYCIGLKDPEMALAVEICLKGQLQAFTCDNYEDEKVLKDLMAKTFPGGRRPNIITSAFLPRVHDTSRRAVNHPEYRSVLQSLEIEDPVVANCLIDQRGIENVLLIKNKTEARRVMQGRQPPPNCSMAISKEGDQIYSNRAYTADQNRAVYLSGDVEEEIRQLRSELGNQTAQAGRFHTHMMRVDDDIRQKEALLKRAIMEQKNTKEIARKVQLELNDLQNVEEPQSEDLKPLEEDLEELMGKISSTREELKTSLSQVAQLKTAYEEAEQEYNQHKERMHAVSVEIENMKEELSVREQEVGKSKHHLKHYQDKLKGHTKNIQDLKDGMSVKEREIQEAVAKATRVCPERLEVNRTLTSLDTEISRLRLKITSKQDQQGNREEIVRQYQEASKNYKDAQQALKSLSQFIQTLEGVITQRLKAYDELRSSMAVRCKYYFDSMLAQREYTGTMVFDHRKETLTVSVLPGQGGKANLSDMRSLSGGERSFSTVCFVLSLWAITEAPFRCLDEFDVYMDMVNRRISMDMMLKVASNQWNRQFIFLTPQSMSSLACTDQMSILRLDDPDRRQ